MPSPKAAMARRSVVFMVPSYLKRLNPKPDEPPGQRIPRLWVGGQHRLAAVRAAARATVLPAHKGLRVTHDSGVRHHQMLHGRLEQDLSFAEVLGIPLSGAYGGRVVSIADIRQLPLTEKLQIMEAIWEDLRAQAEQVPVPAWHQELLDERRRAVEEGREEVLDWDSVKGTLGSRRNS